MAKTVIVTVHGQESVGRNMLHLTNRLSSEWFTNEDTEFINLRYTKLITIVNTLPWVRTMTAKYIAARLDAICSKYTGAKIIVIAHSNGTRATRIAMDMRLHPKKNWPKFKIDNLVLLGCPIKRNYNWNKHPHTEVLNFISSNDLVVWAARFYGMGSAGRYGFKYDPPNLTQIRVKWGHNKFMEQYLIIADVIEELITTGN
jgi:pimeloyl-ACP methyl ester carboxylesterase